MNVWDLAVIIPMFIVVGLIAVGIFRSINTSHSKKAIEDDLERIDEFYSKSRR